jgi:hypothetical protein
MNIMPRQGVLKMGEKRGNGSVSLDHFILPTEVKANSQLSPEVVKSFHEVYGKEPKSLDIYFPSNDINEIMPIAYKRYGRASKLCSSQLVVTPDGRQVHSGKASLLDPYKKESTIIECDPKTCQYKDSCKLKADLYFLLPKVKGFGVWHISTGSFNGRQNIINKVNYIKSLTGGQIAMLPINLVAAKAKTVRKDELGNKKETLVNVVDINVDSLSVDELLGYANRARGQAMTFKMADDNRVDDEHDDSIDDGQDVVENHQEEPGDGVENSDSPVLLTKDTYRNLLLSAAKMGKNEVWLTGLIKGHLGLNDHWKMAEEDGAKLLVAMQEKIKAHKKAVNG